MVSISSTIVEATVYSDRARVTRRGQVELATGLHRVEFSDLPMSLSPESIRVSARSAVAVKLRGVDVKTVYFTRSPNEKVRELDAAIKQLDQDIRGLNDTLATYGKEIDCLDGILQGHSRFARGLASGRIQPDALDSYLRFHAERREDLLTRIRQVPKQQDNRQAAKTKLELERATLISSEGKDRLVVALEIELASAGNVEVDVTYILPGASWQPLYDLRLLGDELEVTYLGEVIQTTGEDWTGVRLSLSTARPAQATVIPLLKPQRIGQAIMPAFRSAPPPRAMAWMPTGARKGDSNLEDVTMTCAGAEDLPTLAEAEVEHAAVEQSGAAVTFSVPGKTDIPSENTPHKVSVGIFRLSPRFDFVAVPKLTEVVFRRVKATNASNFTLLPGKAQLFVADDFLGSVPLKLTVPNQELELAFGVEDRLKVERGIKKQDVGKTMLTAKRRLCYGYEIRLRNHFGVAQLVTVVDHFPRSDHENIKVTLDMCDPKPTRQDDLNTMFWKLTLPANGQQAIKYEYTVEHPREMQIAGLE